MPLFQKNIVNKYASSIDQDSLEQAYTTYAAHFLDAQVQHNIRTSKEEQYQEGFLRDLFVGVFGYTLNPSPDFNLITEKKDETDSKKADGAILRDGEVVGIIELKDHKTTDLKQVEVQAFGYKHQHPRARYVVISNFEKLRLYIDDSTEFIEWSLFELNKDDFRTLYTALAYTQVMADVPAKIKAESRSNEDQITQKLYRDYSEFKRVLFADILEHNPDGDKLLLFKKSQKLLDRLLFIFFAEDSGLLPPNSMIQIIDQWEQLKDLDEYQPLYTRIKKYFGYLDTGHKGKNYDIFAYNGGLFKPDEVLDSLTISDEVLRVHTRRLSEYDYVSEVDVNILGHIFENSLTEIDEITTQLENGQAPTVSKRKKDGVFYTPQYITKYIVENTVGKLCTEKKAELKIVEQDYFSDHNRQMATKKRLLVQLGTYRDWLLNITICDPACGSGAFLNAALQFLIAEHKLIDEMSAKVTGDTIVFQGIENSILEHNLYGVDINEESVEIAKLALWLRTAKPNRKLNSLNNNIKCGNSLISDPAVAGEKAFDWQAEFPQVFAKGGFDVVIGNPPYVNVENISVKDKEFYKTAYKAFYKRSDLFSLFVEHGLCNLTHQQSRVAFIIPSIVLNNLSYQPLRDLFLDNNWLCEVSYVGGAVFSDATVDTSILVFDKRGSSDIMLRHAVDFMNPTVHTVEAGYFKTFKNAISIGEENADTIVDKLFKPEYTTIDEHFTVFQGIVTGNNDAFIFESEADALSHGIAKELLHTLCHGRDIGKWETRNLERKILYIDKNTNIETYLGTKNWLESFKDILVTRRECQKGVIPWYALQWARIKSELDTVEKILIQNTRNESLKTRLVATIDKTGVYASQGINFIIPKDETYSLYFVLALLNSALLNYLFSTKFLNLAIKAEYIKQIRIPLATQSQQSEMANLADQMLTLNADLQTQRSRFLRTLTDKLEGIKISGALETFDTLDFKQFLAEFKKQKITLRLAEQEEWTDYFSQKKAACNALSDQIAQTDATIDNLVFNLYGLTDEEKEIIRKA